MSKVLNSARHSAAKGKKGSSSFVPNDALESENRFKVINPNFYL